MDGRLAQARELTHGFLDLIRHHNAEGLDTWRKSVRASTIREFLSFARSVQQDKAAILAGLTLPYSTGPVEGHINRLKPDLSPSVWPSWTFLLATPLRGPLPDRCGQGCNPLSPPNVFLKEERKKVFMSYVALE
jgi:transposase